LIQLMFSPYSGPIVGANCRPQETVDHPLAALLIAPSVAEAAARDFKQRS
jgi:hypothetical protein